MTKCIPAFQLSFEAADEITLANLKETRKLIKKEMKHYTSAHLRSHSVDYADNVIYLEALEVLIKYYRT